jgi:hypothetical protein
LRERTLWPYSDGVERPAAFLKYRFGEIAHMQNHLHVADGRTLFFYREGKTRLEGGSRVVIEFSFGNSEQVSALRGWVLARVDTESSGGQKGGWIEFPDARLAKRIDQGAQGIAGRHQRRLGCDLLVEVSHRGQPRLGRMIDVSLQGARIVGAAGLHAGEEVALRIIGAEPPLPPNLGRTQIVRADPGGDLAVRFVRSDVIARVAAGKLYAAVTELWSKAPEMGHPAICCQGGHLLEPPFPHMKSRA